MQKYMTKQRKMMLAFLSEHADERLSAQEIAEALSEHNISLSAVYRNLAELEAMGKINKYSKSGSRENCYQFVGADSCRHHLHLQCKGCGKTYHMCEGCSDRLIKNVADNEHFRLDETETVLYGLCQPCQEDGQ